MATMRFNTVMNTGRELLIDAQEGPINILPPNVKPALHIENVEHYANHYGMTNLIGIKFKNGQVATLELNADMQADEKALREFQAMCIMVHDI